jgi:hypothetical protein
VAEASKEGFGSKRAVAPMMMMTMIFSIVTSHYCDVNIK